jgi:hypothetical protein
MMSYKLNKLNIMFTKNRGRFRKQVQNKSLGHFLQTKDIHFMGEKK